MPSGDFPITVTEMTVKHFAVIVTLPVLESVVNLTHLAPAQTTKQIPMLINISSDV